MKYMNAKRKTYLACAYYALKISVILTNNQGVEEFKNNDGPNKLYSVPTKVLEAARYMSTIIGEEFKFDTLYVALNHFITDDESYKKQTSSFRVSINRYAKNTDSSQPVRYISPKRNCLTNQKLSCFLQTTCHRKIVLKKKKLMI